MSTNASEPSLTWQVKFDAICVRFEQALRAGDGPIMESFLEEVSANQRAALLTQLMLLELEYAVEADESADISAYLERFPNDAKTIQEAVEIHNALMAEKTSAQLTRTEDRPSIEQPGAQIDRYKLLEQIGEGGMGVVYMAEQQRPVRRKVALKIIKPGMDTKQVVARFEAERQALAMMDHPNIARVLDAGSTENARPYFVMELVRGIPITEYCDQNKLDTDARLKLFVLVCQAVQHAHTKGIIHRDIKPTNVLVTLHDGVPVPKIIDFGVAKATGQQLTERTLFTAFAQMVGTPLYMSPEQAEMSGLDIDTRSDIYSLGVLLYEMLTGVTPFDRRRLHTAAFDEIRRIIREEEPERPSTRVSTTGKASVTASEQRSTSPAKLKQVLRGELDWIVMKTLEKDRNRRYETASALATEVNRYLDGQAVEACPPSASYRIRKFVRRYKSQVAVSAMIGLILIASSLVAWVLYADARHANRESERSSAEAVAERDRAVAAEQDAKAARDRAEAATRRADQHVNELRERLYDHTLAKAHLAYQRSDLARARKLLGECVVTQRGWEWGHLDCSIGWRPDELQQPGGIAALDVHPAKPIVAVGVGETLHMIDRSTGNTVLEDTPVAGAYVSEISFSRRGDRYALAHNSHDLLRYMFPSREELFVPQDFEGGFQVRDTETNALVFSAVPTRGAAMTPRFSPDGRRLVIARVNLDGSPHVELYDVSENRLIWSAPTRGFPLDLEFSGDGQRLFLSLWVSAFVHDPSTLSCWNVKDHTEIWSAGRTASSTIAIRDDGTLVTVGANHSVQIWDAESGDLVEEVPGSSPDHAARVDLSRDGTMLVSGGFESIAVFDWARRETRVIQHGEIQQLALIPKFSHDAKHIVTHAIGQPTVPILAVGDPDESVLTLSGHEDELRCIAFHPNGDRLDSAGLDSMRTWDRMTGQETAVRSTAAKALAFSPDGTFHATGGADGVRLWHTQSGQLLYEWPEIGDVWWVDFSSDGNWIAAGGWNQELRVWSVTDGSKVFSTRTEGSIDGLKFGHRDSVIVLNKNASIQVFDVESGDSSVMSSYAAGDRAQQLLSPRGLDVAADGKTVVAGIGQQIEIWDIINGTRTATYYNGPGVVRTVVFSHDGKRIFTGDSEGELRVLNAETGEILFQAPAHTVESPGFQGVVSICMSPDRTTLATAGTDGLVKLWESRPAKAELVERRRVVAEATSRVNQLYRESADFEEVMASLMNDDALPTDVAQTAIDIAAARGDRPSSPMEVLAEKGVSQFDLSKQLFETSNMLIELVGQRSGVPINVPVDRLPHGSGDDWSTLATELAEWPIESMLDRLITEHPHAHHFVYLRGQIHVRRRQWREAEQDLTLSLSRTPKGTWGWHWQAYQLASLYLYLEETNKHRELCGIVMADYADTPTPPLAERTAAMCLWAADSAGRLEQAAKIADNVATKTNDGHYPWFTLAKAVADYRRGDYASGATVLAPAENHFDLGLSTKAFCIKSLCLKELGESDAAAKAFDKAKELRAKLEAGGFTVSWNDHLTTEVIYRQTCEVFGEESSGE